jgi:hypothetical protein
MLILHTLNAYLVVQVAKKYLKPDLATLLGVVYGVSSIHFLSLFYIGAIQELIATLFSLLTIHHYVSAKRPSTYLLAGLTLCALLSKELSLRLPVILFILSLAKQRSIKQALQELAGPVIATIVYLVLRLATGMNSASEYSLVLSPATTLSTIMWYGLFFVGFPERILSYGLSLGRIDMVRFVSDYGWLTLPISLSALSYTGLIFTKIVAVVKAKNFQNALLFPLVSLVSLAPIIFLPTHRYPHYLDLFILFFGIWIFSVIKKINFAVWLIFGIIISASLSGLEIEKRTHWTIQRSLMSANILPVVLDSCHNPDGVVFVGKPDYLRDLSYALSVENGPRVICENPQLRVYYKEQP